ncbi:MAG: TolC family protein [Muribaculaceae bacterium]|nr:TolC family protein [Muribaculaceae bacterium]MDE5713429.1 TolC family protein [Muribaculaceae bacterium]
MKRTILSIAIMATSFTGAMASDFDKALNILVSNNLEAKVVAERGVSEIESLKAENALEGVEAEFSRVWGNNSEIGNKFAVSVSQGFDWPGLYAARRKAAKTAESALEFLKSSAMLDARRDARVLLLDFIHNSQLLELQESYASRLDSMETYYKRAAEEGLETRLDYNKTVLERIRVHKELHQLERDRDALIVRIQAFNGGISPNEVISLVGNEYPRVDRSKLTSILTQVEERDPGYAAARLQSEAARQQVKVEKMSGLPGFSIGYEHETEIGGGFNGFSVGINIPSWSRKHSRKAAVLEAELAEKDAQLALIQKKADLESDLVQLDYYEHAIEESSAIVNDSAPIKLLRKALVAQQITLLNYIDEENYFIQAHRDYLDLIYEYNLALARLMYYE